MTETLLWYTATDAICGARAPFREKRRQQELQEASAQTANQPLADLLADLMERYARGESDVFDELYRLLAPPLYRFCRRLAPLPAEADDCLQETFLRLHRSRATYTPGGNVLNWAYAIARSAYLTRLRQQRRRPDAAGTPGDPREAEHRLCEDATPEAELAAEHVLHVVTQTLHRMAEKNRSAYVLIKEEGLSAKEAAAVLGTTVDAVKQRAHRAYAELSAALEAAQ